MKKLRIASTCFSLASVAFYIAAIIGFAGQGDNGMATVWLCLGSSCMCLGVFLQRKTRESEDKDKKE